MAGVLNRVRDDELDAAGELECTVEVLFSLLVGVRKYFSPAASPAVAAKHGDVGFDC